MNSYIFPCPNGGKCRNIVLANEGVPIDDSRPGIMTAVKVSENDIPSTHFYKCCNHKGCNLPYDTYEAVKLNKFLGNKPDDTPIDPDFLRLLDEQ